MGSNTVTWSEQLLEGMKYQSDSLTDSLVAKAIGSWDPTDEGAKQSKFDLLQEAIRLLAPLKLNQDLGLCQFEQARSAAVQSLLLQFVREGQALPDWADFEKIRRAEEIFADHGVLSCVVFFCASLPEVYVAPSISAVLRATGSLEQATERRIRTTATMILTALLEGGIRSPQGGGLPQVLKARFIHAIMRNLILQSDPAGSVIRLKQARSYQVPPPRTTGPPRNVFEAIFTHGWTPGEQGLPCNQEELAYTLLTFGYIFLRSLRRLGLALPRSDEEAYLHFWNVVGFVMGIQTDLMAHTMEDARALFELMQERARAHPVMDDPRPALGLALVESIEKSISVPALKPFGALIIQHLTSLRTAKDLGLESRMTSSSKLIFNSTIWVVRTIDSLIRPSRPHVSITRLLIRIVGYRLLSKALTDLDYPLDLPASLLSQVNSILHTWSHDTNAPRWMNHLEDYFTTRGSWRDSIHI
jgi:hypothetical protein